MKKITAKEYNGYPTLGVIIIILIVMMILSSCYTQQVLSPPCWVTTTQASYELNDPEGEYTSLQHFYEGPLDTMSFPEVCQGVELYVWTDQIIAIYIRGDNNTYELKSMIAPTLGNGVNDAAKICLNMAHLYRIVAKCTADVEVKTTCTLYPFTVNWVEQGAWCQPGIPNTDGSLYIPFKPDYFGCFCLNACQ